MLSDGIENCAPWQVLYICLRGKRTQMWLKLHPSLPASSDHNNCAARHVRNGWRRRSLTHGEGRGPGLRRRNSCPRGSLGSIGQFERDHLGVSIDGKAERHRPVIHEALEPARTQARGQSSGGRCRREDIASISDLPRRTSGASTCPERSLVS